MPSIDSAPLASASINSQETTKPRVRFAEPDEDSQSIDTQATTTATSENVERIDHAQDAINITPKARLVTLIEYLEAPNVQMIYTLGVFHESFSEAPDI